MQQKGAFMTISSSLNASVSGLSNNASRLAAISDNIANSSTFGYKRVETDFQSIVTSGSGGKYSAGGARTTTMRHIDEKGALVTTSNATDLAVTGRGMLPVARTTELNSGSPTLLLTSTGSFRPDADGYLTTDSGLALLGWPALPNGTLPTYPRDTADGLEPVRINMSALSGEPTTSMVLGVNLPATETYFDSSGDTRPLSIEYFDNLGLSQNLTMEFTPVIPATGRSNTWTMVVRDSAQGGAIVGEYELVFNDAPGTGGTLDNVTTFAGGAYDPANGTIMVTTASGPIEIEIGQINDPQGISQIGDEFAPVVIDRDGTPVGRVTGVEVDELGIVRAVYDNGTYQTVYQIPVADMANPNGMRSLDNQTFMVTPDSGRYFLWDAGDGPTGTIASYSREQSTADVASELTMMIQTQRAYASNAKVIQTADEMLQETTNMKR